MPSWTGGDFADAQALYTRRSGFLGESFPIGDCNGVLTPSSGMLYLTSVLVEKGQVVTNIGFKTGTTAGVTPTNWWYGIWTHDTAGSPVVAANTVVSMIRTSGSPTLTVAASGTTPQSLVGRLVTGTGMPASGRVIAQPTPQTVTLCGNATSSGTSNATFAQYAGPSQNIAATTDSTTATTPTADTFFTKPVQPIPWICPGTGLYFFGWVLVASTMANIVGKNSPAGLGVTTWNHLGHSNVGHTVPPGAANPIASVTDVVNWAYAYFT